MHAPYSEILMTFKRENGLVMFTSDIIILVDFEFMMITNGKRQKNIYVFKDILHAKL